MRGIALDGLAEFPADRAGVGLRGIRRTHHGAPVRDAVLSLEDGDVDRAGGHVGDERPEEALGAVLAVERLGFGPRNAMPLERDDAETLGLDAREDLPRVLRLDGIRLDDGECLFHAAAEYTRRVQIGR